MGGLHKKAKRFAKKNLSPDLAASVAKKIVGEKKLKKWHPGEKVTDDLHDDNFEKMHPAGEGLEKMYDQQKEQEAALEAQKEELANPPPAKAPMPIADDMELQAAKRREAARRRRGRSSTILGGARDTLG